MNEELLRVLDAREKRWQQRLALARGSRRTLITVTLCVPVAYRTAPEFEELMLALCRRLRAFLRSQGVHYRVEGITRGNDGPAFFLTTSASPRRVKALCVRAEGLLGGGRMLDIDVMDPTGEPVGRGSLGLPPRTCFVCGEPAAVCVSRKIHAPEDISRRVEELRTEAQKYLAAKSRF